ncbi:MAG: DUF4870 domain-containing protein [Bacilli bacterium]|nr:DUF4870 domain-containing protein [Bacilli bacterium]
MTILDENGDEIFYRPTDEERTLAMLIFLISFFTSVLGPLIIWLIKRKESAYIDHYGREYFNMTISYFIYTIISALSLFILIGFILLPAVGIAAIVFTIIGAVKAYGGEYYRIPFIIRFF